MVQSLNIAHTNVLLEVAAMLVTNHPSFDLASFREDLFSEKGKEAFRKDLQECRYLNITRLPTLIFRSAGQPSVLLSGYQSYESLKNTWLKIEKSI
jgi:predicted DsbA family dithiol-disulfide isomerase